MQAHALRTFLNSRTLQLQHAGTSFEADEDYAKALEQRGIIKTGDAPVVAATHARRR